MIPKYFPYSRGTGLSGKICAWTVPGWGTLAASVITNSMALSDYQSYSTVGLCVSFQQVGRIVRGPMRATWLGRGVSSSKLPQGYPPEIVPEFQRLQLRKCRSPGCQGLGVKSSMSACTKILATEFVYKIPCKYGSIAVYGTASDVGLM